MPKNIKYTYFDEKMILSKTNISDENYTNLIFVRRDIKDIEIPSFITTIGAYAFSNSFLCNVYIGVNVLEILEGAFYKCRALQVVEFQDGSKLQKIEQLAFCKTSLQILILPPSVSAISENWCDNETKIILDENSNNVNSIILPEKEAYSSPKDNEELHDSQNLIQQTKLICYKRKDCNFTRAILKSENQHQKIEIVPENKDCFSFSDFIIFAYSSYPAFLTCQPEKSKVLGRHLVLTSIPNIRFEQAINQKRYYSLRVEFNSDFNDIHVYVKDGLNYFMKDENKCLLIFKYKAFQNFEIFDKIIPNQGEGAMLSVFGQYIANKNTKCPLFLKYTFSKFQSKRTKQYKSKFAHTDNVIKMLHSVPGKILFKYQKPGHGGYTFKCKNGDFITVNSFIWLFPWSTEIIQKIHYLQIDASFHAFPDYSFCLWHGIYYNETIPFALSVYPTEKFELFSLLFECCKYYKIDEKLFKGKIVLSDMGDSIKLFCTTFNMPQFICHRHLIENFGSSSPLGMMVARLIRCKNENEYFQISQEISAELKIYIKFKELYSTIDKETQNNIDKLNIMISGYDLKYEKSNYFIYK